MEGIYALNNEGDGGRAGHRPLRFEAAAAQRVAIGRALVRDVDVFLFDEPLSNLDAKLRGELRVEIKRLHQRLGNTMLYVTHDQIEAMTLADRIAVMKGGVIQQLDAPQAIYSRPVNRFVAGFIGSPGMNFLDGRVETNSAPAFKADGVSVDLSRYDFAARDGIERTVQFGVRPEHIEIGDAAAAMPCTDEVEVEIVEFQRFADARTALATGSLDIATIGPQDVAISLSQGITDIIGIAIAVGVFLVARMMRNAAPA